MKQHKLASMRMDDKDRVQRVVRSPAFDSGPGAPRKTEAEPLFGTAVRSTKEAMARTSEKDREPLVGTRLRWVLRSLRDDK
jgi:hypothetical protein